METGGDLLSRAVTHQVPSALKGLTSVFGMDTGDPLRHCHRKLCFPQVQLSGRSPTPTRSSPGSFPVRLRIHSAFPRALPLGSPPLAGHCVTLSPEDLPAFPEAHLWFTFVSLWLLRHVLCCVLAASACRSLRFRSFLPHRLRWPHPDNCTTKTSF